MLRSIITFLIATLIVSSAEAVQIHSMNMANVLVVDHSQQTLQQALQTALNQVLVKMSGNASVNTVPAIQNAQKRVNNLVVSYSYSTKKNRSRSSQLMLHVVFDGSAVQRLLKNAGQAIWGNDRPLTLIGCRHHKAWKRECYQAMMRVH